MSRIILPAALALGAVFSAGEFGRAQDAASAGSGTTLTLGGKGTIADAAAADDTELTGHHRRSWGVSWGWSTPAWGWNNGWNNSWNVGWGGGWNTGWHGGWNTGWHGGWNTGWHGGWNTVAFRPVGFSTVSVVRPAWGWSTPAWGWNGWSGGWNGWSGGVGVTVFRGINGTNSDLAAPTVALNQASATTSSLNGTRTAPEAAPANGYRYDGGPARPVPQPAPDATPKSSATPAATGLPVSLPRTKPSSPYTYKAYGEK